MSEDRLPPDRQPTLRVVPMPADANASGDIFGGWIMSQVDIAGSIAAMRRAQGRVVTVAVNAFQFKKPVFVGDLISCYAQVTRIGTTSLTVGVEVYAERGLGHAGDPEKCVKVTEATLTYVAIDDRRRKRPLPPAARA
jgi:acyl-CoA thioesterase YciA